MSIYPLRLSSPDSRCDTALVCRLQGQEILLSVFQLSFALLLLVQPSFRADYYHPRPPGIRADACKSQLEPRAGALPRRRRASSISTKLHLPVKKIRLCPNFPDEITGCTSSS
ncbi:hypothetical protein BT96DRAFT_986671 [Gymnopus androsaceus JB14]|uniref:Uncharacterized protein n=1 Tax=Gymnopus androsaceus JB14 TaxID=1447944 RepID=A0A6A4I5W6_9AGAR|nr:hypothetical protein BT96DRAFT_986671 [Gymnopus androsaceus JB14]